MQQTGMQCSRMMPARLKTSGHLYGHRIRTTTRLVVSQPTWWSWWLIAASRQPGILHSSPGASTATLALEQKNNVQADSIQRLNPNWVDRLQESWAGEAFALFLSRTALIAITLMMYRHDEMRSLKWRVSLNSLISLSSTTASTGATYTASVVIS